MVDRLMEARLQKLERLRKEGLEAYPTRTKRTHTSATAVATFEQLGDLRACIAGRMRSIRSSRPWRISSRVPRLSPEEQIVSTRHFMREHNRLGVTSVIDAGGGGQNYPDNYQAIAKLAR